MHFYAVFKTNSTVYGNGSYNEVSPDGGWSHSREDPEGEDF